MSPPLELPPLGERILIQMRTWPPGQGRTAKDLANQMVDVTIPQALTELRVLKAAGRVRVIPGKGKAQDTWGLA